MESQLATLRRWPAWRGNLPFSAAVTKTLLSVTQIFSRACPRASSRRGGARRVQTRRAQVSWRSWAAAAAAALKRVRVTAGPEVGHAIGAELLFKVTRGSAITAVGHGRHVVTRVVAGSRPEDEGWEAGTSGVFT